MGVQTFCKPTSGPIRISVIVVIVVVVIVAVVVVVVHVVVGVLLVVVVVVLVVLVVVVHVVVEYNSNTTPVVRIIGCQFCVFDKDFIAM